MIPVIPLLLGFSVILLYAYFKPQINPKFVGCLVLFLWGFTGVIYAIRREIPHGYGAPYTGTTAIIMGSIWALLWWGLALGRLFSN
jgi:hypothetical protein